MPLHHDISSYPFQPFWLELASRSIVTVKLGDPATCANLPIQLTRFGRRPKKWMSRNIAGGSLPTPRLRTKTLSETPPDLPSHRMKSSRYTSDLPEKFQHIRHSPVFSCYYPHLSTIHYHPCAIMAPPWLLGLVMAQAATGYHCAVARNDTRRAKHAIRVCERRLAQRCRGQNRVSAKTMRLEVAQGTNIGKDIGISGLSRKRLFFRITGWFFLHG